MRSTPGIKLPIGEDIIILDDGEPGLVINESAASEEEEFYAKKECENVNECVALVNGEPACFQIGSEYDVDNFTESGMVEICSENNYWCPKWFDNSNTEKCVFEMDQCYDQTATDTDLCWTQEINETNPEYQNALWIADLDKCSYKSFEGVIRSCCAVTVIHNEPYQSWRDVCILIAGQDNSHCSIVFN